MLNLLPLSIAEKLLFLYYYSDNTGMYYKFPTPSVSKRICSGLLQVLCYSSVVAAAFSTQPKDQKLENMQQRREFRVAEEYFGSLDCRRLP